MRPVDRAGYLAHARLPSFAALVERARQTIGGMLAKCQSPYVSFSAGKDSSVLLALVTEQKPAVEARLLTSGETRLLHHDLDSILTWWRESVPALTLTEINIDRVFSDGWTDADWQTQRKAGRGDIVRYLTGGTYDGFFMGLRDEESNARRFANKRGVIRRYSQARRDGTAGMFVCCPLALWRTADIGAFIVSRGLPYLAEYDRVGFEGRTTARLTGDAMRQNGLQAIRLRDPDGYNRLIQRFPEITWWNG